MLKHHAYLQLLSEVNKETVNKAVSLLVISEVTYLSFDTFGINDVKSLTEKAYLMPVNSDKQLLVVMVKFITEEAQQALLKILEEPPQTTVFLFAAPYSLHFLPTLLSRFQKLDSNYVGSDLKTIHSFLELAAGDRFAEIAKRVENKDNDWISSIKSDLLNLLAQNDKKIKLNQKEHLYFVASHLLTRGASNKQLLEELSLTIV